MIDIKDVYSGLEERLNFMRGLVRISRADSIIAPEEQIFFENAATGFGLSPEQISELKIALTDQSVYLPVKFPTKKQALFFIKEAVQLCYVDKNFTESERLETIRLAGELGLSTDVVDSIESWVLDGRDWIRRGEELIDYLEGK